MLGQVTLCQYKGWGFARSDILSKFRLCGDWVSVGCKLTRGSLLLVSYMINIYIMGLPHKAIPCWQLRVIVALYVHTHSAMRMTWAWMHHMSHLAASTSIVPQLSTVSWLTAWVSEFSGKRTALVLATPTHPTWSPRPEWSARIFCFSAVFLRRWMDWFLATTAFTIFI